MMILNTLWIRLLAEDMTTIGCPSIRQITMLLIARITEPMKCWNPTKLMVVTQRVRPTAVTG